MLNAKDFSNKVNGVRRVYCAIEEAQMAAIIDGKFEFKVVFGIDDKEFVYNVAYKLGFKISSCQVNDEMEFTFSC